MATQTAPHPKLEFHIGDRLRKAREEGTGLDRKHFADKIQVSPNTIRAYESGRTAPRYTALAAWSLATGYPISELVGETPPSPDGGQVIEESSSA